MLSDFLVVVGQVVTLFLMMGVGYFLARRGQLSSGTLGQLSHLLLYVVSPCIVVDSLQIPCTPELTRSIGVCFAALAVTYVLYMLLAHPLYPKTAVDTRDTMRFAVVYGNTSFMGLPLIQNVLGDAAMVYCVASMAVFSVATWTHGAAMMGGRENLSVKKAILNPGVIGCAAGFALFFLNFTLPSPLGSAVHFLGGLNTPLAMVVIGGQMASANLGDTFRKGALYLNSALKLIVMPVLTALVLLPLHLNSLMYCTLVVLSGCPTAGLTGIFAQQFRRDTGTAAQLVTLSTLLSIATLPVIALLARTLGG